MHMDDFSLHGWFRYGFSLLTGYIPLQKVQRHLEKQRHCFCFQVTHNKVLFFEWKKTLVQWACFSLAFPLK